jgi:Fe-Mn family superoxide dismutase
MTYTLPELNYEYNALEPHIDAKTMEIHYTKHHQTYVDNLNTVTAKHQVLQTKNLQDLMMEFETLDLPEADKTMFRNNGGGHLNHTLFWEIMGPEKKVDEELQAQIKSAFGSVETFKEELTQSAMKRFGSGWAWLVANKEGKLEVYSTPNQDSPYLQGHTPKIGLDVWEHAYYLKYQNRRADYIQSWWNVLKVI